MDRDIDKAVMQTAEYAKDAEGDMRQNGAA